MKSITSKELAELIVAGTAIQLIDVREYDEHAAFNIGGILIPLPELTKHSGKIKEDVPVIVYCQKGIRSHIAIQRLQQKSPFTNLVNLTGGMDAWKKQFPG
ncbi:MAG: rhodanese-like domain-containing protein [Sediminibacterium sp.]